MRSHESAASVSIVATVADEPPLRLQRMVAALANQDHRGPLDLVIAAPMQDHDALIHVTASWSRGSVTLLENPTGNRSRGLNAAVRSAAGNYVVRVDARSCPPTDYVRRCVDRLASDPAVGVVGGRQLAVPPPTSSRRAFGIGRALRNHWLLGHSAYRVPGACGPVDTVYLGAFRTRDLLVHGYDEQLGANEDFDLCARITDSGATVWLEPNLIVEYEPRARLIDVYRQYRAFGRAKVAYWQRRGKGPRGRQTVAIGAALGAIAVLILGVRQPAVPMTCAGALVGVYLVTDQITDGDSPASIRLRSVPAHVAIELGWLSGVLEGLVDRRLVAAPELSTPRQP